MLGTTVKLRTRLDALNALIDSNQDTMSEHMEQKLEIRAVGLDEPPLWTTLNLDFDKYYTRPNWARTPEQILSFVTGWVRRARGRPLTLNIDGDMVGCLGHDRSVALITQLAPHVKSKYLELAQRSSRWPQPRRRPAPPSLMRWPLLEEAHVMAAGDFYEISHAFSIAPKLQVISDGDGLLSPSVATVPWTQLTGFHANLMNPEDFMIILEQGENLEDCSFLMAVVMEDGDLDNTPYLLSHSHLKKVVLDKDLHLFFPHLALPALQTLDLSFLDLPDDPDLIADFLERHSSHLEELIMDERLRSFPNDLFELLQSPEKELLPSLQQITLDRLRSRIPEDYETMARALATHWRHSKASAAVAGLDSFNLSIKLVNDETLEDFAELLSPVTNLKGEGVGTRVIIDRTKW
ncbi:hypothetical protein DFH06DRAFT_1414028 [Mycena polygramma]|nr:hypothetical protein DFH06DRAFT_1414028 [Mycena polygramma]